MITHSFHDFVIDKHNLHIGYFMVQIFWVTWVGYHAVRLMTAVENIKNAYDFTSIGRNDGVYH